MSGSRLISEKRHWGEYTVLHYFDAGSEEHALTKHLQINAGCNISYQYHHNRREIWTIISGEGLLALDGEIKKVSTGDVIEIPKEAKHSIKAICDLHIIEVQLGYPLIEEDIVRLNTEWNEMVEATVPGRPI